MIFDMFLVATALSHKYAHFMAYEVCSEKIYIKA